MFRGTTVCSMVPHYVHWFSHYVPWYHIMFRGTTLCSVGPHYVPWYHIMFIGFVLLVRLRTDKYSLGSNPTELLNATPGGGLGGVISVVV
jgi:hypothetical protein